MKKITARSLDLEKIKPQLQLFGLAVSLALLCSCSRQNSWSHERIYSNYPQYAYCKIAHYTPDLVHGIDLEFVQIKNQIKSYLAIHSTPLSSLASSPKKIKVDIEIDRRNTSYICDLLQGGQRILLPEHVTQLLIDTLLSKKKITISLPGYHSSIEASNFKKKFSKMHHHSLLENPFRLPF